MKETKQKEEDGLSKIAEEYIAFEDFFVSQAHYKAKTPREMLQKISTLLKDLNGAEITCLYCRLCNLFNPYFHRFFVKFTCAEFDEAIDAAHKRRKKEEEKEGLIKWHPDYTTMRQDTKGSPEDEKIAKHLHYLSLYWDEWHLKLKQH